MLDFYNGDNLTLLFYMINLISTQRFKGQVGNVYGFAFPAIPAKWDNPSSGFYMLKLCEHNSVDYNEIV